MNASDGGTGDTIGGNSYYNVYLSQNNGSSFLNSGDGSSTAINLPTATNGLFTYQFYYNNSFANSLQMTLFFDGGIESIAVKTNRDTSGVAFSSVTSGSDLITYSGQTITLTDFSFTNSFGPAASFSVTPGSTNNADIIGQFTYQVHGSVVPEPSSLVMLGMGSVGILGYLRRRTNRANH